MGANESENAAMMATCKIIAEGQKFFTRGHWLMLYMGKYKYVFAI